MAVTAGKTFKSASNVDLNAVNDAQKAAFSQMVRDSEADLWAQRKGAYLGRWKEALVYARPGDRLLDIGSGWPIPEVHDLIIDEAKIDYFCVDIDPSIVSDSQAALEKRGLKGTRAQLGPNTTFAFADRTFDFVFSSHCLEHSDDLPKTFAEITRILKDDGILFFSVPIGFDDSDEHLLYLDIEDWQTVLVKSGFDLLNVHIGKTYPMAGWDVSFAARNVGPVDLAALQLFMLGKTKFEKTLVYPSSEIFKYSSEMVSGKHVILDKPESSAVIMPTRVTDLLLLRHDWSGFAEISYAGGKILIDLYSRIPQVKAVDLRGVVSPVMVKPVGPSGGKAAQVVIFGALLEAA